MPKRKSIIRTRYRKKKIKEENDGIQRKRDLTGVAEKDRAVQDFG